MSGLIHELIDLFLHLDQKMAEVLARYQGGTYVLLFAIVFLETGLVVTPFLPGDSLLFAAGTFAAKPDHPLDIWVLLGLLSTAAFLGDTVNYWIGRKVGPKVFHRDDVRFLNKKHLQRTHAFYERYGGKTIILARFVPIVRTFAPFVAGIGQMSYGKFISYNIIGGVAWVAICLFAGFFFGSLPFVQKNFSLVVMAIILVSVMPAVVELLRERARQRRSAVVADD